MRDSCSFWNNRLFRIRFAQTWIIAWRWALSLEGVEWVQDGWLFGLLGWVGCRRRRVSRASFCSTHRADADVSFSSRLLQTSLLLLVVARRVRPSQPNVGPIVCVCPGIYPSARASIKQQQQKRNKERRISEFFRGHRILSTTPPTTQARCCARRALSSRAIA